MHSGQWFVLICGVAGIVWVNWYFFPRKGVSRNENASRRRQ